MGDNLDSTEIHNEVNDDSFDVTTLYTEKNWGKEENGQQVVDGYSFRGKQSFLKVVEGFKTFLRKGVENEFNETIFKALDIRKQGDGLEIDTQITDKNERGIAVIKLYGPSKKKKENVVMVTKYKESDSKFVTKMTEKVIKPMIKKYAKSSRGKSFHQKIRVIKS